MLNPIATYRIQFHKDFTFEDFERMLPYLQKLGVKTVYASPVFEATPGSTHGYDGLNPHRINPQVGTVEQLQALSKTVHEKGMMWLQDIVPNHMAFDPRNAWLMDVLEKGPRSVYAPFFDVDWNSPVYEGRLLVPFLGAPLEEVIQKGELQVAYVNQRFVLKYYDSAYPLRLESCKTLLSLHKTEAPEALKKFVQQLSRTSRVQEAETYSNLFQKLILQLATLMEEADIRARIERNLRQVNSEPKRLQALADDQFYRLCYWQQTDRQINYRRFFTVNGLICLNIQDEAVFNHYHQFVATLLNEGVFQGLRVDHIDGLYDPTQYLQRLRALTGDEAYLVVEKILAPDEQLPDNWPVQGNTGYDFLSSVNNLFTNRAAKKAFTQFYYALVADQRTVPQQIRDAKAYILYEHMGGELENLYRLCLHLNIIEAERLAALPEGSLQKAIGAFLVHCPVYRYYATSLPLNGDEANAVQHILNTIRQTEPALREAVAVLEEIFFKTPYSTDAELNNRATHFYKRCMQFSGPLMAKGVEDTVMYTFNRFIGHNEVGDAPDAFGMSIDDFHKHMKARQQSWPLSINATSTHDTKRGEDFRARLNVLTDMPDVWLEAAQHWIKEHAHLKKENGPDVNDEYFIYQTIAGSYPAAGAHDETYAARLKEYLQKAMREAKRHSNWTAPNEAYEQATKNFAVALLDERSAFWKSFQKLQQPLLHFGIVNSLAQVLLKFTCPGVPDVYQGCEGWDFSFVDPDNRRPVDYGHLKKLLNGLTATETTEDALQQRTSGAIKTWLVHTLLQLRNTHAELFAYGDYIPLKTEGVYKDNVLAFVRRYRQEWLIVVVPLHIATLLHNAAEDLVVDWRDTAIVLPKDVKPEWQDVLRNTKGSSEKKIFIKDVFTSVPFAILKMQGADAKRSAGILMHITSLPAPFGIGDLGPEAKRFADFLHRTGQRFWQLLPINPTEGGQGHSPYSATSSRAGNVLLISPEEMVQDGLLTTDFLEQYHLPVESKTDYAIAERIKDEVFQKAWQHFQTGAHTSLKNDFDQFKNEAQEWLPHFALYTVLKQQQKGKPWYEWPTAYKMRDADALQTFSKAHTDAIEKQQWLQFLFARQWNALKQYCNARRIQLIGDLPIYVSYDSVDVWANPELFRLDAEGNRLGIAGVPPDAFSEDGQLWGMPVYNWAVLKERNYDWWIERLRKNRALFDVIRLDHFRAFADYWEVPAGETTAKNGSWIEGPGASFFEAVKAQLGELPFIAEDLGEINDAVLELRDAFNLPGMKILQFAFGEDFQTSDYIPHNYAPNFIVYTGTHDNNTTRGWFRQEASQVSRAHVEQYLARPVDEASVAHLLCRLAHASVAKTVILPMQDVLELDERARMNTPASGTANWGWRLLPRQITKHAEQQLRNWTKLYNRD